MFAKPGTWKWFLLLALIPLLGWWTTGLFDLDEGFYAAIAAEMNRRGEWITPFFNGRAWYEKPILVYWAMKPALMVFGEQIGPRLPSVLANLGTYALVGWFARRRFGVCAARVSVLVAATTPLLVAIGRLAMTDALLVLSLTGALLTFWESLVTDPRWRLATAACLGFGVLAKGPVALILFGIIAAYTYATQKELRPKFEGYWTRGVLLLFGIIALWYVPALLKDRALFVNEFLIEQNLKRFTGGDEAHTLGFLQGLVSQAAFFVVGFFPWWLVWAVRLFDKSKEPLPAPESATIKYLLACFLTVLLFFTLSGAKLPHYVAPAAPMFALLTGHMISRLEGRKADVIAFGLIVWLFVLAGLVQFGSQYYYRVSGHQEIHELTRWVREQRPRSVAAYQMPRRDKALGTGKPKVQETSHPSIVFYLDQKVLQTDEFSKLLNAPKPLWILTRWNRISDADVRQANAEGFTLERVQTPVKQDLYAVWRLTNPSQLGVNEDVGGQR